MDELKARAEDLICEIHAPEECAIGGDWACTTCRVRHLVAELKPRVCRGCKQFDGAEKCRLLFAWQDQSTGVAELYRHDKPPDDGYLKIYDPDDFGCNKWEAKE